MPNPSQSPAVQAALSRRAGSQPGNMQQGQGALTQTSPGAAMANPAPQMPNPSDATKASAPQQAQPQDYKPQNQQDMIVSALIEQMHNSTKLQKEQMKMGQPTTPSVQPSMGALPVAQTPQGQQQPPMDQPPMPPADPSMGAPQMGTPPAPPMGGGGAVNGLDDGQYEPVNGNYVGTYAPCPVCGGGGCQACQANQGGGGAPTGMNDPNFLKPISNNSSSSTMFNFGAPSMATSQKGNQYSF